MDRLLQDLRYTVRQLARAPGFALITVLTLGLGIGATTTLFSVVHGVLLQALPYPAPERIVRVFEIGRDGGRPANMSDPNFADLAAESRSFEALAPVPDDARLRRRRQRAGAPASPPACHAASSASSACSLSSAAASSPTSSAKGRRRRRSSATATGSATSAPTPTSRMHTLRYGGAPVSVVGVMPPGFAFPPEADLWFPRELGGSTPSRTALNSRAIGRLRDDVPLDRARRDVSTVARRLAARFGDDTWMADAALVPLHEELVGRARPPLLLLLGASGLLLIIACANVVNLLLARAATRRRELAVRIALGAGRGRLTRLSLTESLVLSLLGGVLGVGIAHWGLRLLLRSAAGDLPRLAEIHVDGSVLAFALLLSIGVAVGLALLVAWRALRDGADAVAAAGERTQSAAGTSRVRSALVVSQVALTLMLLAGSGLLLRSFQHLLQLDPGYRTAGALVLNCYLPYPESDEQAARQVRFYDRLISRLRSLPGVAEVGGTDSLPLRHRGASGTFLHLERPDEVTDWESFGAMAKQPDRAGYADYRRATPGYFQAMQIPLLRGRLFDDRDQPQTTHVAVISESLAAAGWPGDDPIGKLVQFGNMDGDLRPFTVVGIVGDVRDASLEAKPAPTFYADSRQRPGALAGPMDLVLVARADAAGLAGAVRRLVHESDPQVAPSLETLSEIRAESLAERRFQLLLLGIFAATALLLAAIGVYGMISFHVAQRRREMGVRLALGASGATVVRLVLHRGLLLAGLGVAVGLAAALAAGRLMRSLVYGVTTTDPVTFLVAPLVLLAAAALACYLPARRAARVDPLATLRE